MTKQMIFLENEPAEGTSAAPDPHPAFDDDPNDFRIDAHARAIGRIGIAAARHALAEAVRRAAERDQAAA
ncbi:MAG: hypothetical protein FWC87_05145 [Acidimicrobiaceae bacterium]|nr:hypothetical protein [Acidimicrobiaceae bacterium]